MDRSLWHQCNDHKQWCTASYQWNSYVLAHWTKQIQFSHLLLYTNTINIMGIAAVPVFRLISQGISFGMTSSENFPLPCPFRERLILPYKMSRSKYPVVTLLSNLPCTKSMSTLMLICNVIFCHCQPELLVFLSFSWPVFVYHSMDYVHRFWNYKWGT